MFSKALSGGISCRHSRTTEADQPWATGLATSHTLPSPGCTPLCQGRVLRVIRFAVEVKFPEVKDSCYPKISQRPVKCSTATKEEGHTLSHTHPSSAHLPSPAPSPPPPHRPDL